MSPDTLTTTSTYTSTTPTNTITFGGHGGIIYDHVKHREVRQRAHRDHRLRKAKRPRWRQ